MTTISEKAGLLTFINVFTVSPENQSLLLELLTQATDVSVRHAKGFVSSALHRSLDGTKVTMYAPWQSMEDYQVMRENPAASPYLAKALTIATFEPGAYNVIKTFTSSLGDG
jgi:quinol monooxygenase YgiN